MSSEQITASSAMPRPPQEPPGLLRRLRFPLIVLVLCGGVLTLPFLCSSLELEIEAAMPINMGVQMVLVGSALLLSIWWLFFAGFRWTTRFLGVVVVALLATGFYFSVAKFELTTARVGGLVPRLRFVWETSPEDQLARHLAQPTKLIEPPGIDATVGPHDFAAYRGPQRDGAIPHAKLNVDWGTHPPKIAWAHPCVEGYSGIAVAGNIAVTIDHRDGGEAVVCFDRATGRQRWVYRWDAEFRHVMGNGPRSTPTIHEHHIYALGGMGDLVCLDAQGRKQWSVNVLADAKAKNVKWGLSGSPLIVDDVVVVHAGIDPDAPAGEALIAYDRTTGGKRWAAGNRRASYSSPLLATLAGTQQILIFAGDGLAGCDAKTGKELWFQPWESKFDMNSIQPLLFAGDRVFISSEAENGCTMLKIKADANGAWQVETVWKTKAIGCRFANPITDGKHIWGLHGIDGKLTCVDAANGKRLWDGERFGPGQLLLAGSQIVLVDGNEGTVYLLDADAGEYKERGKLAVFEKKTWNTPALAGNQLFVRNQTQIACVQLP